MGLVLKKYVIVFFLSCLCFVAYGQKITSEALLAKVETHYKSLSSFCFTMHYKMYRGHTGTNLTEQYSGTIQKSKGVTLVDILGAKVIHFPEHHLVLDEKKKTLIYDTNGQEVQTSPIDISKFLQFYKVVKTKEEGSILIYELLLKETHLSIPHKKVVMYINKNSLEVNKQILYLGTKVPFKSKNGATELDMARIEVTLNPSAVNTSMTQPKLNDYIELDANNKVYLAPNYKAYTLIDNTKKL